MPAPITQWMGTTPETLREQIQLDIGRYMRLRRATVAVTLLGIGSMALTTLLQMGIVRRLPDPPCGNFDTKKVNSSDEAYSYGGPDSPINILAHSVNLVLASTGGADRAREHPWLPILAAAMELPQTIIAAKYLFYQMPCVDKAWCPYCITDALTHFATLGLVLPEAIEAVRNLSDGGGAAAAINQHGSGAEVRGHARSEPAVVD
ncbi:MAG: vitamin K epoxide reductase family protein [Alphaproteobacteria bacterium]